MKIGDTIWKKDCNRRVYFEPTAEEEARGKIWGPLDPSGHWVPFKISGETARSWIVGRFDWDKTKIPKKGPRYGWALSEKERDDYVWIATHRHLVANHVTACLTADTLKKVAELVGYVPQPR